MVIKHRYDLPATLKGHFDHFTVDEKGGRLFATAVEDHLVVIIDIGTGRVVGELRGVIEPRAVVYRADLARLYVSDGAGFLRIYDSKSYRALASLSLAVDADPMVYDAESQNAFIVNGGEKAAHTFSNITVVDTAKMAKVGEIHQPGIELEGMTIETHGPRIFVNNRDRNEIDVFDRRTLKRLAVWPITRVKKNTVSVLDETTQRLYVAGHEGQLAVIDSTNGKELATYPIGAGADDIALDTVSKRIYIAAGGGSGSIDVYQEVDANHLNSLGQVTTAPGAATARLVAERGEYLVLVPARVGQPAQLLVYAIAKDN